MATHSNILAWKIPWTEEPGGLQYMGSQGIGHDLLTNHTHAQLRSTVFILIPYLCLSLSHVRLFATPWTVTHQTPLSLEFSRQEYQSGLPFPTPRDLSHLEIDPVSLEFGVRKDEMQGDWS